MSPLRVLAIESAGAGGGIALAEDGRIVSCHALDEARGHGRLLVPMARAALDGAGWTVADLDRVAVDVGPGSYTGIRIGLSIAKSLSLALDLPVAALDRFDLVAGIVEIEGRFAPVLDARRGHVAFALFERAGGRLARTSDDLSAPPVDLAGRLATPTTLFGSGAEVHRSVLALPGVAFERPELLEVDPATVARAAFDLAPGSRHVLAAAADVDDLVPIYLRATAAEEKKAPA